MMTIEERNDFVVENSKFVHHLLKPWRNQHNGIFDYNDLMQVGFEQMIKCANTWNPEAGKFSTYAGKSIICAVRTFIRKNCTAYTLGRLDYYNDNDRGFNNVVSLDAPASADIDNTINLSDVVGDIDASFELVDVICSVKSISDSIFRDPTHAYNAWMLKHIYGYSQPEIAKIMNKSQAMISRYITRINRKLMEV